MYNLNQYTLETTALANLSTKHIVAFFSQICTTYSCGFLEKQLYVIYKIPKFKHSQWA